MPSNMKNQAWQMFIKMKNNYGNKHNEILMIITLIIESIQKTRQFQCKSREGLEKFMTAKTSALKEFQN